MSCKVKNVCFSKSNIEGQYVWSKHESENSPILDYVVGEKYYVLLELITYTKNNCPVFY